MKGFPRATDWYCCHWVLALIVWRVRSVQLHFVRVLWPKRFAAVIKMLLLNPPIDRHHRPPIISGTFSRKHPCGGTAVQIKTQ